MIVGFSGFAGAGKTTAVDHLVEKHGFLKYGFADALRELALEINPPVEGGRFLRDHIIEVGWEHWKSWGDGRRFLQNLGVGVRKILGEDAWVEALGCRLLECDPRTDFAIPDVRFPNEARWVKDHGGFVVRVNRPGVQAALGHVSDVALNDWPFDYVVSNEEGIPQLDLKVDRALEHLKKCMSSPSPPTSSTPVHQRQSTPPTGQRSSTSVKRSRS